MNRIFLRDASLIMGATVASTVQLPSALGSIEPFIEVELWQAANPPVGIQFKRRAYVLGAYEMHVCDIPDWVLEMHYDPERRTHAGLIEAIGRKNTLAQQRGSRLMVQVLVLDFTKHAS